MNEYEIISSRVGEPGKEYVPSEGVNVDALIEYGFIKVKSKPKKSTEEVTDNG
jgi:hypothetical protein